MLVGNIFTMKAYTFVLYSLLFCRNLVAYYMTCSPSKPHAQMNQTKLSQKRKELKLLVRFYENRIYWLCHGSRKYFGLIRGSRIAMIVETSDQLFSLGSGLVAREYSLALNKLVEDQFEKKDLVYCIWYGSSPTMTNPQGFPFTKFTQQ